MHTRHVLLLWVSLFIHTHPVLIKPYRFLYIDHVIAIRSDYNRPLEHV
jgi:hypothetical protein